MCRLPELLLLPGRRINEYVTLLSWFELHTPSTHQDRGDLADAIETLKVVNRHVQEVESSELCPFSQWYGLEIIFDWTLGIFQQEISLVSTEQLLSHWTYICGKLRNSCFRDQALFTKHLSKCKNDWFQTSVILSSVQSVVFFSLVEQDQDGQRQKDDKAAEDYTQLSCKSDLTSQSNLLKTFMILRLSHSAKLKYSRDSTNDF